MKDNLTAIQLLEEHGAQCSQGMNSKEFAEMMDANDPLSSYRSLFHYPKKSTLPTVDPDVYEEDDEALYYAGHSLGLCPRTTDELMRNVMKKWQQWAVLGHFAGDSPWIKITEGSVLEHMGEVVGAREGEVVIMHTLSPNLHFLMVSFYQPTAQRHKILVEAGLFPSDLVVVRSQIELHNHDPDTSIVFVHPRPGEYTLRTEDIVKKIEDQGEEIALVMFSGVQAFTGQFFDLAEITRAGHKSGCYVGFDLAHAVGNVVLKLHDWDVDFAAWCTYKYLNGGPGCTGGAFVHEKHFDGSSPTLKRLDGWWGIELKERFGMDPDDLPFYNDARAYAQSCPSVLSTAPLIASLEIMCSAGIDRLREKQILLTGYLEYLLYSNIDRSRFEIISPSNPADRGSMLSIRIFNDLGKINEELRRCGVICDTRRGEFLRVAPVPVYSSFKDVYEFVRILNDTMDEVRSVP